MVEEEEVTKLDELKRADGLSMMILTNLSLLLPQLIFLSLRAKEVESATYGYPSLSPAPDRIALSPVQQRGKPVRSNLSSEKRFRWIFHFHLLLLFQLHFGSLFRLSFRCWHSHLHLLESTCLLSITITMTVLPDLHTQNQTQNR